MKLSIVTVARNNLHGLKTTISDFLATPTPDTELIVVDGASTDGTVEYLKQLDSKFVRILSEPDTGIYNAMNKGIRAASGKFVYFLNAGDRLTSLDALRDVVERLREADVYYCDILLNENGLVRLQKYSKNLALAFWLREHMCHQAAFFRRSLFEELGPYCEEYRFAADYDLFLHAWAKRKKFEHIDVAIAVYDMHGVSANVTNHKRIFAEYHKIQRRRLNPFQRFYNGVLRTANDWSPQGSSLLTRLVRKGIRVLLGPVFGYRPSHQFFFGESQLPSPKALRVAHINTYSSNGGAAIASVRLHKALQAIGVHSQLFTLNSDYADKTVVPVVLKHGIRLLLFQFLRKLEFLKVRLTGTKRAGINSFGNLTTADLRHFWHVIKLFDPDVVHIHWISHHFLRVQDLEKLNKPIVWTFHDMWPMLGLQHLSLDENHLLGFKSPEAEPLHDLDRKVWLKKEKHWSPLMGSMSVVCPSHWMKNQALTSPIWKNAPIHVVGNSVPTDVFRPFDKSIARQIVGIDGEVEHVLIFGAASPFLEPAKGYANFMSALEHFTEGKNRAKVAVITFGENAGKNMISGVRHYHLDFIRSLEFIRVAYCAADVLVVSSAVESFCLVAAEAQACGVPVACFDTAGLRDVVEHKATGYRAQLGSNDDLGNAIQWIVEDKSRYQILSANGRKRMVTKFDSSVIAKEHLAVYEEAIARAQSPEILRSITRFSGSGPTIVSSMPSTPRTNGNGLSGHSSASVAHPAAMQTTV